MTRVTRAAASLALGGFTALHVVVLVGPALVLAVAADKGGVPGAHGFGLLLTSAIIAVVYSAAVWQRLRRQLLTGRAATNACIAAFDALVVLAVMVTALLFVVLGAYAPFAVLLINRGWPVVALWGVVQLLGVAAAEIVRGAVLRWLRT